MIFNVEKQRKGCCRAAEGYLSLGMPEHALDALNQLPGADHDLEVLLLRGDALRVKQDHQNSLDCFLRAHSLHPENLDALLGMAWCYKRLGRVDLSIESLRLACQSHSDVPIVLYNLACYYALSGDKEHALSWLGRALRMNPELLKLISDETDFDRLRNDTDFQHLLHLFQEHPGKGS